MGFVLALALVSLFGAVAPAAASAATPVAAVGSDLVPALVIAGAGALVITLIMVLVPAARRGPGSATSAPGPPAPGAFRARPVDAPEPAAPGSEGEPTTASAEPPAAASPAAVTPEPPAVASPAAVTPEPPAAASPAAVTPEPPAAGTPEPPAATPEPPTAAPDAPAEELGARQPVVDPEPFPPSRASSIPAAPDTATVSAAASPAGAVALADPPREARPASRPEPAPRRPEPAVSPRPEPAAPPRPEPALPRTPAPAPDLLAAFSPTAVLGDSFDPERLRQTLADRTADPLGPEGGARALLRDHSLLVPLAACVLVGVTVHLVRARRR